MRKDGVTRTCCSETGKLTEIGEDVQILDENGQGIEAVPFSRFRIGRV